MVEEEFEWVCFPPVRIEGRRRVELPLAPGATFVWEKRHKGYKKELKEALEFLDKQMEREYKNEGKDIVAARKLLKKLKDEMYG